MASKQNVVKPSFKDRWDSHLGEYFWKTLMVLPGAAATIFLFAALVDLYMNLNYY